MVAIFIELVAISLAISIAQSKTLTMDNIENYIWIFNIAIKTVYFIETKHFPNKIKWKIQWFRHPPFGRWHAALTKLMLSNHSLNSVTYSIQLVWWFPWARQFSFNKISFNCLCLTCDVINPIIAQKVVTSSFNRKLLSEFSGAAVVTPGLFFWFSLLLFFCVFGFCFEIL